MKGRTIKIGLHGVSWLLFLMLPMLVLSDVFERVTNQNYLPQSQ